MIGMGRQAQIVNMQQFLQMKDVQIVAICDVDSWRLQKAKAALETAYAQKNGQGTGRGIAAYVDFHDLVARTSTP